MSKDKWFVSDTHFGHANIIKYSKRPFATVQEHDRQLIENWNVHVKPGDDVFFLGDFAYRSQQDALDIRRKLNGAIYFIEGNHDSAAWQPTSRPVEEVPSGESVRVKSGSTTAYVGHT